MAGVTGWRALAHLNGYKYSWRKQRETQTGNVACRLSVTFFFLTTVSLYFKYVCGLLLASSLEFAQFLGNFRHVRVCVRVVFLISKSPIIFINFPSICMVYHVCITVELWQVNVHVLPCCCLVVVFHYGLKGPLLTKMLMITRGFVAAPPLKRRH